MGYIHDTEMSQYVPPSAFMFSAGTWAAAADTYIWSMDRSAADAAFWVSIPIPVPSNSGDNKGAYLKSIEVMYEIETTLADDFATVKLFKDTFAVDGSSNIASDIAITLDAAHNTAAERKALDQHRMVATLDTPAWIDSNEGYHFDFYVDAAAGTVFKCVGAIVNYTLRL